MGRKTLLLALFCLLQFSAKSQACITTHFSGMIIQGEAMGRGYIGDDLGLGLNLVYGLPLGNRAHFNLVASHLRYSIDYMSPGTEQSSYYYGKGSHSSVGVGLMIFPFAPGGRASLYQPFRLYIAGNGGMAVQHNKPIDVVNLPSSFTVFDQTKVHPYAEAMIGIKIRVNPKLSFDVFAAGRSTFSDDIDGLAGTGAGSDIIGRVGIGICSKLY